MPKYANRMLLSALHKSASVLMPVHIRLMLAALTRRLSISYFKDMDSSLLFCDSYGSTSAMTPDKMAERTAKPTVPTSHFPILSFRSM